MKEKEIIPTDKFHQYVPASRDGMFNFPGNPYSLKLDTYLLPPVMDEVSTPILDDHALGVVGDISKTVKIDSAKIEGKKLYSGYYKSRSVVIVPRGQMASYKWHMKDCDIDVPNTALFLPKLVMDRMVIENLNVDPSLVELIPKVGVEDHLIYEIAQQLKENMNSPSAVSQVYLESATQFLVAHVLKNYCTQDYKFKEYQRGLNKKTLSKITEYIDQNLEKAISLQDLAALSRVSGYHFIHLINMLSIVVLSEQSTCCLRRRYQLPILLWMLGLMI